MKGVFSMENSIANIGMMESSVLYVKADARTAILLLLNCSVENVIILMIFITFLSRVGYFSSSAIHSSFWKKVFHFSIGNFFMAKGY